MRRLEIINGPNNNFYGIRNKDVYGSQTYDGLIAELMEYGAGLGFEVHAYQNNSEGALIDHLQELYLEADRTGVKIPVVLNPGAYTHYSYALMDALESVHALVPAIEVHMSNIQDRDSFRHISVTAPSAWVRLLASARRATSWPCTSSSCSKRRGSYKRRASYGTVLQQFAASWRQ